MTTPLVINICTIAQTHVPIIVSRSTPDSVHAKNTIQFFPGNKSNNYAINGILTNIVANNIQSR